MGQVSISALLVAIMGLVEKQLMTESLSLENVSVQMIKLRAMESVWINADRDSMESTTHSALLIVPLILIHGSTGETMKLKSPVIMMHQVILIAKTTRTTLSLLKTRRDSWCQDPQGQPNYLPISPFHSGFTLNHLTLRVI